MDTKRWNTVAVVFALTLGLVSLANAGVVSQQASPESPSITATDIFRPDRNIEDLAKVYCPTGLERFLPGSYYYCVGVRDMAKGNQARSRRMLRIAAGWGNKSAQFLLGMGYYKGDVEPLDRPLGLAWMGLAVERRDPTYSALFNSAWQRATPQERAQAQTLWQTMLPTYGDARAARRAELRFKHERDALLARGTMGQQTCIVGLNVASIGAVFPEYKRNDNTSPCGGAELPVEILAAKLDVYAEQLFDGWAGHVTVGPLRSR